MYVKNVELETIGKLQNSWEELLSLLGVSLLAVEDFFVP